MGRSFYTGTESELRNGTQVLAAKLTTDYAAYSITLPQSTAYAALNTAWQTAWNVANNPETRTKATVQAKNDLRDQIRLMTADLAKLIEASPSVTNQQKLDVGLSVRDLPGPVGEPGTPQSFKMSLDGNGDIILKWKCPNPPGAQGTIYQVWRQIDGQGEFQYVGGSGLRMFIDRNVPAGATNVTYQIQAIRSTGAGPWATFNVYFGKTPTGTTTATGSEAPAKIAA